MPSDVGVYALFMSLVIFLAVMAAALLISRRLYRRPVIDKREDDGVAQREIVALKCLVCGYSLTRGFIQGDYVGRVLDEACPRDGSRLVIYSIYVDRGG